MASNKAIMRTATKAQAKAAPKAPMATPKPAQFSPGSLDTSKWGSMGTLEKRYGPGEVPNAMGVAQKIAGGMGQAPKGLLSQPPAQAPQQYKRVSPGMYQGADGNVVRAQTRQQLPQQPQRMDWGRIAGQAMGRAGEQWTQDASQQAAQGAGQQLGQAVGRSAQGFGQGRR